MVLLLTVLSFIGLASYLFVSGFHDAPNSVAVPVRTRALTPMTALRMSAICNFLGVILSGMVFSTLAHEWVTIPENVVGLGVLATALLAQCAWGFITWWLRMPSSSTHALIGGLLGAAWASGAVGLDNFIPFTESAYTFVLIPLLLMPVLIFVLAWFMVFATGWFAQRAYPRTVNRVSRSVMSLANSIISLVHGMQIGQRATMLFALIMVSAGLAGSPALTAVALVLCAVVLAAGTMMGGWRIGYTFAHKMVYLDPYRGSVAQGTTALTLLAVQFLLGSSVSSSHMAAASVLGAGLNQRFSSVRPGIVVKLMATWLATIPATFVFSATLFLALSPLLD